MSDKKPDTVSTLAPAILATLGTALRNGATAALNAGSLLADFLAACVGAKLPALVPPEDVSAIANAAYPADSADPKVLKVRRSEARNIVRAHASLPEGITALRTAAGKCGYNQTVALARRLSNGESVASAVAAMVTPMHGKVDHDAKLGRALQAFWNASRDGKRKTRLERMAATEAFAASMGITLKTE